MTSTESCPRCNEPIAGGQRCPRCDDSPEERPLAAEDVVKIKPAPSCAVWIAGPLMVAIGAALAIWMEDLGWGAIWTSAGVFSIVAGLITMKKIVVDAEGIAVGRRRVSWDQVDDVRYTRSVRFGDIARDAPCSMKEADRMVLTLSDGTTFAVVPGAVNVLRGDRVIPAAARQLERHRPAAVDRHTVRQRVVEGARDDGDSQDR